MPRRVIAACVGLLPLLAVNLHADCPELVGRWPYGPANGVAVAGDHAFFGSGAALMVADISDPGEPRVVGDVTLPGVVQAVAVAGGHAYVAASNGGLRVIDISTPSAPMEVGIVDTPGDAAAVAVAGGYAYVADWNAGLRVVDVSDPAAPVEVGFYHTPGEAYAVAVAGSYAYVANWEAGLRVVDVSDPAAPVEVGFYDTPDYAGGVAVAGWYAYVADGRAGLRVVDVSDPAAPVEVGFYDTPGNARGVAVAGGYAYVADETWGLRVIDVRTPSAPVEAGFCDTPGYALGVAVAGSYAYVADLQAGLRVIDVSDPAAPVEVGFCDTPGYAHGVAVAGGYAYVADGTAGLRVVDVSDPAAPVEVGFSETPGWAFDVAVAGGYAYVVDETWGLRVIDVSTPSAPVEVGFYDTPGYALAVAVAGSYAYVADDHGGLRVVDVSDPAAPVEVGFSETPGWASDVAVVGSFAYVADGYSGLRVIDVSDPATPVEVESYNTPDYAHGVAVAGGYAYVADGGAGLRVVDVSDPATPVEVGFCDTPGYAWGVAVAGSYAYVAATSGGLRVIDVSNPAAPVEVGFSETPGSAWDVAVSDGYAFVADDLAGLSIFRECVQGPDPDGRVSFIPAAAVAAGAQGAFFQTDVEINNTGTEDAQVSFQWLPRGEDNSEPIQSDSIAIAAGQSLRWENVLTEVFGLGPDSLGALKLVASTEWVIGMSRTYNIPAGETAGTFGQGLPAIRATEMIKRTQPQRIIFLSEDFDSRANVGCVNGSSEPVTINIEVFNSEGESLVVKTMDLGAWSNNQINHVFQGHLMGNGYVDVRADSDDALYYCYGSMLDNLTSDPTTILPQLPSADTSFIPAAALAAGLEGAFFQTDIDLNNVGSADLTYRLVWLPRGADNSNAVHSDTFSLAPGAGVRYANVLDEVFGLEADQVGALELEASGTELLAMSRTYNLPSAKVAGTFGQELPGIPADMLIASGVKKRIIFMNENDDVRANVGCQNGSGQTVRVFIELFNSAGESLETKTMDLAPYSNNQITRVFRNHAPVSAGYVDVWTYTAEASIYCYGSVLDNLTSDPTTVLPQ